MRYVKQLKLAVVVVLVRTMSKADKTLLCALLTAEAGLRT